MAENPCENDTLLDEPFDYEFLKDDSLENYEYLLEEEKYFSLESKPNHAVSDANDAGINFQIDLSDDEKYEDFKRGNRQTENNASSSGISTTPVKSLNEGFIDKTDKQRRNRRRNRGKSARNQSRPQPIPNIDLTMLKRNIKRDDLRTKIQSRTRFDEFNPVFSQIHPTWPGNSFPTEFPTRFPKFQRDFQTRESFTSVDKPPYAKNRRSNRQYDPNMESYVDSYAQKMETQKRTRELIRNMKEKIIPDVYNEVQSPMNRVRKFMNTRQSKRIRRRGMDDCWTGNDPVQDSNQFGNVIPGFDPATAQATFIKLPNGDLRLELNFPRVDRFVNRR